MPNVFVNFAENKGNVVYINNKLYVVTYADPLKSFSEQMSKDCRINVDGKIYPLVFRDWRLCSDLRYRKRIEDELGFSGPYSAFSLSSKPDQAYGSKDSSTSNELEKINHSLGLA